jgi:hypothetical protein
MHSLIALSPSDPPFPSSSLNSPFPTSRASVIRPEPACGVAGDARSRRHGTDADWGRYRLRTASIGFAETIATERTEAKVRLRLIRPEVGMSLWSRGVRALPCTIYVSN